MAQGLGRYAIATGEVGDTVYEVYSDSKNYEGCFIGKDLCCRGVVQVVSKSSVKYTTNKASEVWDKYKEYKR